MFQQNAFQHNAFDTHLSPASVAPSPVGKFPITGPQEAIYLAGYAMVFAVALASSNTAQAAEYTYGTHAAAIYESQFKGAIWGPSRAAITTAQPVAVYVKALEQAYTNPTGWVIGPLLGAKPQPIALTVGSPQADPSQTPASVFKPLSAGQTPPKIGPVAGSPQADTSQLAAAIFPSARTPPVIPNPIAGFVTTLPQFEERVTQTVMPSQRAGQTPPRLSMLTAGPQSVDLTLQGFVTAPLSAPPVVSTAFKPLLTIPQSVDLTIQGWIETPQPNRQGGVPPILSGAPQGVDLTVQGWVTEPLLAPPVIITGPTVQMLPAVPPQPQLDVSYSVLWTQSTFSPSGPVPPPVITETPAGRRVRNLYRITIDGVRFECRTYQEALDLLAQAKETARKLAEDQALWAIAAQDSTREPVAVPKLYAPKIEVSSRELRSAASQTKRDISAIYESEAKIAELRILLELSKRQQDDDDVLSLFL